MKFIPDKLRIFSLYFPAFFCLWGYSSLSAQTDTASSLKEVKKSVSGIDNKVIYNARDTVIFYVKKKQLRLKGDAVLDDATQKIEKADIIEIDFDRSTMKVSSLRDSTGRLISAPTFTESGETYVFDNLNYNFKTKKGVISMGETSMGEGFYYGEKIKRVSETELFIKDGFYTTCDDPDPHYHFGSPEMKMVANQNIFLDPVIFYVEDVPVFILPFGIFFPTNKGRSSGILVPTFVFTANRGVVYQDFGFYWAASDYFDSQITADIYTKGGYLLKNRSRWNLADEFTGSLGLEYGYTRFNTDEAYTEAWKLGLNHSHTVSPQQKLTANLNFYSANFNQNTSVNIRDRAKQTASSNANYNLNFDNSTSLSVAYSREQNIIDNSYSQQLPVTYTVPNVKLAEFLDQDLVFSLRSQFVFSDRLNVLRTNRLLEDSTTFPDTARVYSNQRYAAHNPSLTYNFPQIGYFRLQPRINFNVNQYTRRITRTWDSAAATYRDVSEPGFFNEYNYSMGLTTNTRLYGISKPGVLGIKAMRHTFEPSLTLNYSPDLSSRETGFYDSYIRKIYNRQEQRLYIDTVEYSRFALDGGTHASSNLVFGLAYNFNNKIEIKIAESDTADKNLELLNFNISGNYNAAADSLKFSSMGLTFRSPAIGFLDFNGSAGFNFYDQAKQFSGDSASYTYRNINTSLLEAGKGLMRLERFQLSLSTSFSSEGLVLGRTGDDNPPDTTVAADTVLGQRFLNRVNHEEEAFDFFAENNYGYRPLNMPWSLDLGVTYDYFRSNPEVYTEQIAATVAFSFRLTDTWNAKVNTGYDFIKKDFNLTNVAITKDMHCWDLQFSWTPFGFIRGFYLRFGIKSDMLRDLKIEKRENAFFE